MAVDADPAARKLFERPCRKRSSNRAELLTELRPEHGKVRLHAHLHRLDFAELDVFHAQLVTDLFGVGGRSACTLNDHATQRLPELQSGRRSRLTPELDDLADRRHLGKERVVSVARLGPAGEKHRSRCVVRTQDTPHVLRQERHHGRDDLHRPNERVQQDRRGVRDAGQHRAPESVQPTHRRRRDPGLVGVHAAALRIESEPQPVASGRAGCGGLSGGGWGCRVSW